MGVFEHHGIAGKSRAEQCWARLVLRSVVHMMRIVRIGQV